MSVSNGSDMGECHCLYAHNITVAVLHDVFPLLEQEMTSSYQLFPIPLIIVFIYYETHVLL